MTPQDKAKELVDKYEGEISDVEAVDGLGNYFETWTAMSRIRLYKCRYAFHVAKLYAKRFVHKRRKRNQ